MESKPTPTHIGGQAVLEGVMLRGKANWVVSVRRPDGQITSLTKSLPNWARKWRFLKWPLLRGSAALAEAVTLGLKALSFSAQESSDEDIEIGPREMAITMVIGFAAAMGLFFALPVWLARFSNSAIEVLVPTQDLGKTVLLNVVEGLIRIAIFLTYLILVSRLKDIKRVFEYHGAEHKTIHAFEHGVEMVPEKVEEFDTEHVRCGTSFLMVVMVVSIFIFVLLGRPPSLLTRIGLRLIILPIVAGVSYELIKFAGLHDKSKFVRIIMSPGLALQKLTTRQPSRDQVEVALVSLNNLLAVEGESDR